VIHTHTIAGMAVSAMKCGVLPIAQTSMRFGDIAYHDYEGVAFDHEERPRLQKDLGAANLMLLRNHGTLTVGQTVGAAFTRMYFLERACSMQVATLSSAKDLYPSAPDVIAKNEAIAKLGVAAASEGLVWPALLRKLDRVSPGFRD
jgi:ribulose-5-phosphate 4-epimerase/fuculose-1-phosphate aldolase